MLKVTNKFLTPWSNYSFKRAIYGRRLDSYRLYSTEESSSGQSTTGGRKRISRRNTTKVYADRAEIPTAPPPMKLPEESWVAVKDQASGKDYWWNQVTNETTAVGAAKPETAYLLQPPQTQVAQPVQYQQPTLGQVVKEGFAFGVGAGIARGVVGSIFGSFGGGSSGNDDDSNDDGGFV